MRRRLRVGTVVLTFSLLAGTGMASATSWTDALASSSKAQAQAQVLPSAPAGVSAACTSSSGKTIKVTWSAVTHASSYSVYKSTTSSSSGFSVTATGVVGVSWTSGTLSNATYWFQMAADIGTNWLGANSASTASHIISTAGCV
jgi:hypothetical protein